MWKKLFLLITPLAFLFLFLALFKNSPSNQQAGEKIIQLGDAKIAVEVADTDKERTQGLSGRPSLPRDRGMLFVFSSKNRYSFWMKEMKFPLDFIWIDKDKVVDLTPNVPYPKNGESPVSIIPKVPVDKVLEVNAGVIDSSQVKIGDQLADL